MTVRRVHRKYRTQAGNVLLQRSFRERHIHTIIGKRISVNCWIVCRLHDGVRPRLFCSCVFGKVTTFKRRMKHSLGICLCFNKDIYFNRSYENMGRSILGLLYSIYFRCYILYTGTYWYAHTDVDTHTHTHTMTSSRKKTAISDGHSMCTCDWIIKNHSHTFSLANVSLSEWWLSCMSLA